MTDMSVTISGKFFMLQLLGLLQHCPSLSRGLSR